MAHGDSMPDQWFLYYENEQCTFTGFLGVKDGVILETAERQLHSLGEMLDREGFFAEVADSEFLAYRC
jgi:hypothetical protein